MKKITYNTFLALSMIACGSEDFRKSEGEKQYPEAFLEQEKQKASEAKAKKKAAKAERISSQKALQEKSKSSPKESPEQVPASALLLQRFFTADTLDSNRLRLLADEILHKLPEDSKEFRMRIEEIRRYLILNYDLEDPEVLDRMIILEDALNDFIEDWNERTLTQKRAWQWGGFLAGGIAGTLFVGGKTIKASRGAETGYLKNIGRELLVFPPVLAGAGYAAGSLIGSFRNEREEIDIISLNEISSDFFVLDENFSSSFREYMDSDFEDMEGLHSKAELLAAFVFRHPEQVGFKWDRIRELYRKEYASGQGKPEIQRKARILEAQIHREIVADRNQKFAENEDTKRIFMVVGGALGAGSFMALHRYAGETGVRSFFLYSFVGLTVGGTFGLLISPISPDHMELSPLDKDSILDAPESRER